MEKTLALIIKLYSNQNTFDRKHSELFRREIKW